VRTPRPPESPHPVFEARGCGMTGGSLTTTYQDGTRIALSCYEGVSRVSVSRARHPIPEAEGFGIGSPVLRAEFVEIDPMSDAAPEWVRTWYADTYLG
jgi:hypothetical protein